MRARLALPLAALLLPGLAACGSDEARADSLKDAQIELTAVQEDQVDSATAAYADWVRAETTALLSGTKKFVTAVKAGDDDLARSLYAPTRMHWERIEPVAETFGDLDPRTDAREADVPDGEEWTGWHRLEKDLWPRDAGADYEPLTAAQRADYADRLLTDLSALEDLVADASYDADSVADGGRHLLEEVASSKVTGEEEIWSHTDLYDFQANIDGAFTAFSLLRPVVRETDPELTRTLADRFSTVQRLLGSHREGEGFVSYNDLTDADVKALSDAVNALAEPLAGLKAAV